MSSQFSLKGKVIVITGATKGLGEGMAEGLAEANAEIILVHRPSTDPSEGVRRLQEAGAYAVHTLAFDSSVTEEINKVLTKAIELSTTGEVNALINNAGVIEYNLADE